MVRITSLCDNVNNSKRLWSMEGNCVLVEADGLRIVYDVGRDAAIFTHNLGALGLTPAQLDYVVLSHGHHGHVGAMRSEIAFTSAKFCTVRASKYPNSSTGRASVRPFTTRTCSGQTKPCAAMASG